MTTDELLEVIDAHLQEVNDTTAERVKRIEDLLDYLNYNLRFTKLSLEEKQDFFYCNEGYPVNEANKKITAGCATETEKEYYFDMWGRANYFRLCAWLTYLGGQTKDKPTVKVDVSKFKVLESDYIIIKETDLFNKVEDPELQQQVLRLKKAISVLTKEGVIKKRDYLLIDPDMPNAEILIDKLKQNIRITQNDIIQTKSS